MVRPVVASLNSVDSISASEAGFSQDRCYRWWLRRSWRSGQGTLLFIGLNPSAADGQHDDPTLRRLCRFARGWGFRDLVVLNLFARVSRSPAALMRVGDPVGRCNDDHLIHWAEAWADRADLELWCGWGVSGGRGGRDRVVIDLLMPFLQRRRLLHPAAAGPQLIGRTRAGYPRHPLYAPRTVSLRPFVWAGDRSIRHPENTPTDCCSL